MTVAFEEIASPPLLFVHVGSAVASAVLLILGMVVILSMARQGKFDEYRRPLAIILSVAAVLAVVSVVAAFMAYPLFRVQVRPIIDVYAPYATFEFEWKEWVGVWGMFVALGAAGISWITDTKGKAYGALLLAILAIALGVLTAILAVGILTTYAI